jgi:hypothetical protein
LNDVKTIVEDFRWLPFRYHGAIDSIQFVLADRNAHRAVTFLDSTVVQQSQSDPVVVPLAEIRAYEAALPANACHYIFHSAFCRSTLLARAFDLPGHAMGLKEPMILNDFAEIALRSGRPDLIRDKLQIVLRLLARPFAPGEDIVVKPSNAASVLWPLMLELDPRSRALLLSSALPDFLRSVAEKGLWGRIWGRKQAASQARRPEVATGFSEAERWEHSDLQVTALVWLHHRAEFSRLTHGSAERTASLDSSALMHNPRSAFQAVAEHFCILLDQAEIERVVAGPAFSTDAKSRDRKYDSSERDKRHLAIDAVLGEEIVAVTTWAEHVAGFAGVPMGLPRPLPVD